MSYTSEALLHMHPGRHRKPKNHRSPDGRSNGETPEQVRSVVKAQRMKAGAAPDIALDYRWECTLGRLWLECSIDQRQFNAAERYRGCVFRYARIMGIPNSNPHSASLLTPANGLSCEPEKDPEEIDRIKGEFRDARRVLLECGASLGVGSRVNRIVYAVVILDWKIGDFGRDDMGDLKCGLNELARMYR